MSSSFELRRLRYFVKVAELQSLTRAAAVLHVAQPALSHHMHALENELGLKLLERGSRGVTLTEAGALLLEEARESLARVERMVERVKAGSSTPEGDVVIGVGQTIGSLLMVPLLEAAARELPRVRIQSARNDEWLAARTGSHPVGRFRVFLQRAQRRRRAGAGRFQPKTCVWSGSAACWPRT